jgi:hypothetical protein
MALWFLRGLRRGVVTTRYPARPDDSAARLPTPPVFWPGGLDRATASKMAEACPSRALVLDQSSLVFDVGACTACGRCAEIAPQATAPSGVFELAATTRSHLVKRIPLPEARG